MNKPIKKSTFCVNVLILYLLIISFESVSIWNIGVVFRNMPCNQQEQKLIHGNIQWNKAGADSNILCPTLLLHIMLLYKSVSFLKKSINALKSS